MQYPKDAKVCHVLGPISSQQGGAWHMPETVTQMVMGMGLRGEWEAHTCSFCRSLDRCKAWDEGPPNWLNDHI